MKGYFINILAFVLFICICLNSCKKKKEGDPPSIQFELPIENSSYNVFSNIQITAHTYSASPLTGLKIGIVNDQLIPVMSTIPLSPVTHLYHTYYIYDIHLSSGTYYIWISASNEDGLDANAYRKIYITEAPKKRRALYLVTKTSSSSLGISRADSVMNNMQSAGSFSGDYSGSGISSWHQQLYLAGNYSGDYRAIELSGHSVKWSVPCISSSNPFFTGVSSDEKKNYLSWYNGNVKVYDQNGSTQYSTSPSAGYYPLKTLLCGNQLLQEQKDKTGSTRKLVVYTAGTGAGKQETILAGSIVEMFTKDADNVYVLSNASGQARMEIYTISGNSFWNRPLPAGQMLSATQVDANTLVIAYDNGTIYKYTYSNNSLITWKTGVNAVKLRYDDVNGELCLAELLKLSTYDFNSANLKKSLTSTDTILDLQVLFNK